jgi:O-antigen polymerase
MRQENFSGAQKEYKRLYPVLKYNHNFLFNYGAELTLMNRYQESIKILEETEAKSTSVDYYNYLGNSYEGTGNLTKALECFEKGANLVPVKFYPRYRMLLIYDKLGQEQAALKLARETIDMPVKIEEPIVFEIKDTMKKYIAEKQHNAQQIEN